jgi:regulator of replication initiation timing
MSEEKTLEGLQADLAGSLEALEKERQMSEDLTNTVNELKEKLAAAEEENETLKQANESLKAELAAVANSGGAAAEKTGNETFEYEGATYEILAKAIRIPGLGKRSALDIVGDPDAQKKLVDSKSGAIRQIV